MLFVDCRSILSSMCLNITSQSVQTREKVLKCLLRNVRVKAGNRLVQNGHIT